MVVKVRMQMDAYWGGLAAGFAGADKTRSKNTLKSARVVRLKFFLFSKLTFQSYTYTIIV